jgi:hypothetical protein
MFSIELVGPCLGLEHAAGASAQDRALAGVPTRLAKAPGRGPGRPHRVGGGALPVGPPGGRAG